MGVEREDVQRIRKYHASRQKCDSKLWRGAAVDHQHPTQPGDGSVQPRTLIRVVPPAFTECFAVLAVSFWLGHVPNYCEQLRPVRRHRPRIVHRYDATSQPFAPLGVRRAGPRRHFHRYVIAATPLVPGSIIAVPIRRGAHRLPPGFGARGSRFGTRRTAEQGRLFRGCGYRAHGDNLGPSARCGQDACLPGVFRGVRRSRKVLLTR